MNFKKYPEFVRYQLPALAWMVLIFALSSVPGSTLSEVEFPFAHPIAHALLYGSLYYLGYRALKHQQFSRLLNAFSIPAALIFVAAYGASDEWHQSITPGRTPEVKDFLIDLAAGAAVLAVVFLRERLPAVKKR